MDSAPDIPQDTSDVPTDNRAQHVTHSSYLPLPLTPASTQHNNNQPGETQSRSGEGIQACPVTHSTGMAKEKNLPLCVLPIQLKSISNHHLFMLLFQYHKQDIITYVCINCWQKNRKKRFFHLLFHIPDDTETFL